MTMNITIDIYFLAKLDYFSQDFSLIYDDILDWMISWYLLLRLIFILFPKIKSDHYWRENCSMNSKDIFMKPPFCL